MGGPQVTATAFWGGGTAGFTPDEQGMIDEYLAAMKWDRQTAMPSAKKLDELGLRELVEAFGGAL